MRFIYSIILIFLVSSIMTCNGNLLEDPPGGDDENAIKLRSIWMVGGLSGSNAANVVAQIDLYDPVTNNWQTNVTSIPTPVSFAGAVSYLRPSDNHHLIIVLGGFDASGVVRNLVQIYDIEDNSWSDGTVMTAARANVYATRVYDKVYIMGGTTGNASVGWGGINTNYEYTIGSTWNTKTAYGGNNSERFTYTYNDIVYNIAGRNGAATVAASVHDGFSISANALTSGFTEVAMSTNRTGVAGTLWISRNGPAKIFLIGGFSSFTGTPTCLIGENSAITASVASNLFQYLNYPFVAPSAWVSSPTIAAYPLSVGFGSAAVYNDILYHFGGTSSFITTPSKAASGTVAAYSTDLTTLNSNTWTSIANMPVGRYGFTALTIQQ